MRYCIWVVLAHGILISLMSALYISFCWPMQTGFIVSPAWPCWSRGQSRGGAGGGWGFINNIKIKMIYSFGVLCIILNLPNRALTRWQETLLMHSVHGDGAPGRTILKASVTSQSLLIIPTVVCYWCARERDGVCVCVGHVEKVFHIKRWAPINDKWRQDKCRGTKIRVCVYRSYLSVWSPIVNIAIVASWTTSRLRFIKACNWRNSDRPGEV